ncbi:Cytochrome P450 [Yoonia rosea]|uniref:Cytochrome P450 n=1 Tax=Yoonia rosea TaxID=287098 RepID=A0A1R3WKA6_9RHOB|nr:cytochrome P450 [Yoonia rosea]SIT77714.1 Cytochrome P450 [Yoonia rosea]
MNGTSAQAQSQVMQALRADPTSFLYSLSRSHPGKDLVLPNAFGGLRVIQNPATAQWVLSNKDKVFEKYVGFHKSALGRSRLTADGADWRYLRDISQERILAPSSSEIADVAGKEFAAAADSLLRAAPEGDPVLIDDAIDVAAMRVLCRLVFKIPPDMLSNTLAQNLRSIFRLTTMANWTPSALMPDSDTDIARSAQAGFQQLQSDFARLRENNSGFAEDNLLARILNADPERTDPLAEFATLLVAGYETTASAITWILFSLARAPSLQEAVRAELGQNDGESILLHRIIAEALRLFPPVPALGRIANREAIKGDLRVQRGQRIVVSLVGVNLGKVAQEKPFAFHPDRFAQDDTTRRALTSAMSFGHGQRVCPGANFAIKEIESAVIAFLQRLAFRIDATTIGQIEWGISMRRKNGTQLRLSSLT